MFLTLIALALSACTPSAPPSAPDTPAGPSQATPAPPAAPSQTAPADAPPDVVVVTLDTTRADHLGLYGYFRDTSPHLDALGADSLVFEQLIVPMATTLPTHTSLWTGVWPAEHGILANVLHGGERFVPSPKLRSFAQVLHDEGYRTGAFVSAAPLRESTGVLAGFDTHTEPPEGKVERPAKATTDDALAWLAEPTDQPVLLWVHYYDPHNPFRPPKAFDRFRGPDPQLDAWIEARQIAATTKRPTGQAVAAKPSINGYDGEIAYMDHHLGRLLDALKARGRWDQTVVVVLGDHGEGLNQHGQPGHGLVWEEQLHAPLLFKAPGLAPGRQDGVVSVADVFPTVLGMVDLPGGAAFAEQSSGRDLRTTPARPVLSQTSARQLQFGRPMTYALTSDTAKCVWAEGTEPTGYDRGLDPYELAPTDANTTHAGCLQALATELARQQARATELGAGQTEAVDAARVEELRQLGYLDDDAQP